MALSNTKSQMVHGTIQTTKMPYIFDSAQILKGLLAVRDIYPLCR